MRVSQCTQRLGPRIDGTRAHGCKRARAFHRCASLLGPEEGSEYIPIRKRKRQDGVPSLDLSKEDAVQIQLLVCERFRPLPNARSGHDAFRCFGVCEVKPRMALQALQNNDMPYQDAGVELLYR